MIPASTGLICSRLYAILETSKRSVKANVCRQLRELYFQASAETESKWSQERCPVLIGAVPYDELALAKYHPAPVETDQLISIFFENVNPFVPLLNKNAFLSDMDKYRRGKHPQQELVDSLLFSMYGLAVMSLESESVIDMFGPPKGWLLDKYQEAQELALHRLNFVHSSEPSVFQNFLYYLVSRRGRASDKIINQANCSIAGISL